MAPTRSNRAVPRGGRNAPDGFTLLELLVALTVVSVAAAMFVGMFNASLGLSRSNSNVAVATELAETQLAALLRAPQDFVWTPVKGSPDLLVTANEPEPPGGYPVQAPAVTLVTKEAQQQLVKRYAQFRWAAHARLAAPDAAAYEVTVSIRWSDAQRPQTLTLTSAVARALVDKPASAVSVPAAPAPVPAPGGTTP